MEYLNLICKKHNIKEVFNEVKTTGLANNIFMSESYVLRIPTEHEEAISDSLTEAIAAPLALNHGIKTRKLIAFDYSYDIISKPYSIWEKVEGRALSELDELVHPGIWKEVGVELKKLHSSVNECEDVNKWLDNPDRDYKISDLKKKVLENNRNSKLHQLIERLENKDFYCYQKCFVHGDTHSGNILCKGKSLASIIDWGDAGWGDPAIDYYMIPSKAIKWVIDGYFSVGKRIPDDNFFNRIVMDKIAILIESERKVNEIEKEIFDMIRDLEKWNTNFAISST